MKSNVFCYLPTKNGLGFTEAAWGMAEMARKIADEKSHLVAIVVHAGMRADELECLPFDEVYQVKLEREDWKVSDFHVYALQSVLNHMKPDKGVYLFSSDPLYHEIAVRQSVRQQAGIITNAMEIKRQGHSLDSLMVKREIYKEKAHEFVVFEEGNHYYLTLENSFLYGEERRGTPARIQEIKIKSALKSQIRFVSECMMNWKDLKITEARCVIGIGRGVYDDGGLDDIIQLAEALNAPIGGSKVADELGLIPREKRIGASGSAIEADIYIAIGISGASQHLEGIKGVQHVVAINNDPSAPIFQRCDAGIVGDYKEVVPRLVQTLHAERKGEEQDEYLRIG